MPTNSHNIARRVAHGPQADVHDVQGASAVSTPSAVAGAGAAAGARTTGPRAGRSVDALHEAENSISLPPPKRLKLQSDHPSSLANTREATEDADEEPAEQAGKKAQQGGDAEAEQDAAGDEAAAGLTASEQAGQGSPGGSDEEPTEQADVQPRRASQTRTQQTRRQQQSLASKRARDCKQVESEDAQPKPDEVADEQPSRKRRRRSSLGPAEVSCAQAFTCLCDDR